MMKSCAGSRNNLSDDVTIVEGERFVWKQKWHQYLQYHTILPQMYEFVCVYDITVRIIKHIHQ